MTRSPSGFIEAKKLSKRYGEGKGAVTALRDVSFTVDRGEYIAIMGPSGSGKSSLMNMVGLLDRATSGQLFFGATNTTSLSADELAELRRQHIGFVFQSYQLMARRTALQNVELSLKYGGIGRALRKRRSEAALDRVGVSHRADAYPKEMSGGEQQRVAIARALVGNPSLLIADEPTGALDTASGDQVLNLLESAWLGGCTVLLITHDLAVADRASRVMMMHDGRLKEGRCSRGGWMPPQRNRQTELRELVS